MKRKTVTSFVLFVLFLVSIFPMSTSFSRLVDSHSGSRVFGAQSNAKSVDWWPMFHHDPAHTGYSTSTVPNTNRLDLDKELSLGDLALVDNDSVELVTGLDDAIPNSYTKLLSILVGEGGKLVKTVSMDNKIGAVVAEMPRAAVSAFASEVKNAGLARYIEPDTRFKVDFVPNDPDWSKQWGPRIIQADYAWNTTRGNDSILVAVIDTGIDWHHPDLAANYAPLGYDWVNNDTDPMDDYGHGTHCAGIIAAVLNNSIGIAGLAQVRIMAEKAIGGSGWGWAVDFANAIVHAVDQGADVLSLSWGGVDSALIHDAIKYAFAHGALVIAAAGNSATECKHYPAAYEEVVAVTATDESDKPASFTNFGDWVEVAAPGVNIYSTMPTIRVSLNDAGYAMNYDFLSGTSMACPQVAAVAALIWSRFPNMARDQVRAQLRYTADDLGDPGFDEYYGFGRVNARRAVEQAVPEQDIAVLNWQSPSVLKPFDTAKINGTVLNFGSNDESFITMQLWVNETVVDSVSISQLASGESTTPSLTWSPLATGRYNITLYAAPVEGETVVENNLLSKYVAVRSSENIMVPSDFPTIQKAINEAYPGYTIQVAPGTYREHLVIDRSIALVGEDPDTTIIDGNGTKSVIIVASEQGNVSVSGFTVRHSGWYGSGILLECSNNNITENVITNNDWGIWLIGSVNNTIVGNTISSSSGDGMFLQDSGGNLVRNNWMTNNAWNLDVSGSTVSDYVQDIDTSNIVDGKPVYYWVNQHDMTVPADAGYVAVVNSTGISVQNLNLTNNGQGVLFAGTSNSTISNMRVSGNVAGVDLVESGDNFICGNRVIDNLFGIWLYSHCNANIIKNNDASACYAGILLEEESNDNIIENNTASENVDFLGIGMILDYSSDNNIIACNEIRNNAVGMEMAGSSSPCNNNTVYLNNFVDNTKQVVLLGSHTNAWDNGYPCGGNYWSDYAAVDLYSGFYQNETEGDGIGDTSYTIDAQNRDRFPYMIEVKGQYIPGDLNHDGRVDGRDLITAARAFATTSGDPRWKSEADVNQDGKVDGRDMVIMARNFGK